MNKSESIKNISTAMIKVQEEIKGMTPDAKNPFFKSNYITLDGILEYIRPLLSKNQIWLVQEAKGLENHVSVRTSLYHSSGEFLEMEPSKNDPQVVGSLITYMKRYQLAALLGISSEVDDDGNKASGNKGGNVKSDKGANKNTPNPSPSKQQNDLNNPQVFKCSSCDDDITEKIYKYSKSKFGKPLCFKCQKGGK